jgi:hypothetical protein
MLSLPPRRRREGYCLLLICVLGLALVACSGSKKKTGSPTATQVRSTTAVAAQTVIPGVPIFTPGAPTPTRALTSPSPTPLPSTPTAAATPAIHEENGLQIQDVTFAATVSEPGGVRIRSAPQLDPNNIVGSLPQGAPIQVTGEVLNGAEAEQGLGKTWCIVGVQQYIYCGKGYISQGNAAPTPAR